MKKIYLQAKFISGHPEIKDGEWNLTGRHNGYDIENEKDVQVLTSDVAYYERQEHMLWNLVEMVEAPTDIMIKVGMNARALNTKFYN